MKRIKGAQDTSAVAARTIAIVGGDDGASAILRRSPLSVMRVFFGSNHVWSGVRAAAEVRQPVSAHEPASICTVA